MRALRSLFRSSKNTAITVGAGLLMLFGAKTLYDCATGNCNQTAEETQRMLHIQNAVMSLPVKIVENIVIRVMAPVLGGIFAGTMHEITNRFCCKPTAADSNERTRLINNDLSNNTPTGGTPTDDTAANTAASQNNLTETAAAPGSAA